MFLEKSVVSLKSWLCLIVSCDVPHTIFHWINDIKIHISNKTNIMINISHLYSDEFNSPIYSSHSASEIQWAGLVRSSHNKRFSLSHSAFAGKAVPIRQSTPSRPAASDLIVLSVLMHLSRQMVKREWQNRFV